MQAQILEVFEEMERQRLQVDPRIARRAETADDEGAKTGT